MNLRKGYVSVAAVVAIISAFSGVFKVFVTDARAQTNQVIDTVKSQVKDTEAKLQEHIRDEKVEHAEIRQDIKALYNYLLTREKQPRLENK